MPGGTSPAGLGAKALRYLEGPAEDPASLSPPQCPGRQRGAPLSGPTTQPQRRGDEGTVPNSRSNSRRSRGLLSRARRGTVPPRRRRPPEKARKASPPSAFYFGAELLLPALQPIPREHAASPWSRRRGPPALIGRLFPFGGSRSAHSPSASACPASARRRRRPPADPDIGGSAAPARWPPPRRKAHER